jgi:hypothetical protein
MHPSAATTLSSSLLQLHLLYAALVTEVPISKLVTIFCTCSMTQTAESECKRRKLQVESAECNAEGRKQEA